MSEPTRPPAPASSRRRIIVIATAVLIIGLIALLYPQLMDLGAEIYRAFND